MSGLYRVQIFTRGRMISEQVVEAASALAAIDLVEASYGSPPVVKYKTVYHEDGSREHLLVVSGWHGYSFLARNVEWPSP